MLSAAGSPWSFLPARRRLVVFVSRHHMELSEMRRSWFACILTAPLWLGGCTSSGFQVERIATDRYPPSSTIELLRHEPVRPYGVVAEFRGSELAVCSREEPYCTLRQEARELGANAIWIRNVRVWTRPEQWLDIGGRMTRVPPADYETIDGVFIRYRD